MKLEVLRQRAKLLDRLRQFFRMRGFLEVETPLAAKEVIPEQHIQIQSLADGVRHLQASPELHMKRLLCAGSGPIFQVTRSFRGQEQGKHHNPEFTIVEWYRPGDDMRSGMDLLDEILQELLGTQPALRTSYREAFERAIGVDPHQASLEELSTHIAGSVIRTNRDELLNLLLSQRVEPALGRERSELLYHYPASQAALAETVLDDFGIEVAERFELYSGGLELANGYHELTDAEVLRKRLELANKQRITGSWPAMPMPESLLEAMRSPGLPACAGVALGFDRLAMLAVGAESIEEVLPFSELL